MEQFRLLNRTLDGFIGLLALVFASTALADACKITDIEGDSGDRRITVWNSTKEPKLATASARFCHGNPTECEDISSSEPIDPKSEGTVHLDGGSSYRTSWDDVSVYCE